MPRAVVAPDLPGDGVGVRAGAGELAQPQELVGREVEGGVPDIAVIEGNLLDLVGAVGHLDGGGACQYQRLAIAGLGVGGE